MLLHTLRLLSFRAHSETDLSFAPGVNLLYGPNGAGKTNILEAVHYLCLTKSFLVSQDSYALRKGSPFFEVEGRFESRRRPDLRVRLVYVPEEGKKVFLNRSPMERLSHVVGELPVVVFSPEDQALTNGGPDERRRFLNNIMSQERAVYLDDVMKYRRALRQRNELLSQFRRKTLNPAEHSLLESWSAELITLGSRIVTARQRFVGTFCGFLEEAYGRIETVSERPSITYQTVTPPDPDADEGIVEDAFREKLSRVSRRERELGRTLAGPHLDELVFRLNGFEVRRYASQGQHRTFGMALKLAQYFYLKNRLEEKPILLLDDVFGGLDPQRSRAFVELLQTADFGQSLITAAAPEPFLEWIPFNGSEHRALHVASVYVTPPD